MLHQYHSELGEKPKYKTSASKNYFINKWAVRTPLELKGRGIKLYESKEETQDGRNFYYCTDKAFEKLCKEIDVDQELLFD